MAAEGPTPLPYFAPKAFKKDAGAFVANLPRGEYAVEYLAASEWYEAYRICRTIRKYAAKDLGFVYSPSVPGCGIVDRAIADIRRDHELIEVKTVTRPFRSSDFRQVLTYAAMYYASGVHIEEITLLNPRRGRYFKRPIDLVAHEACGLSGPELMQELVELMTGLSVSA
ncbi:hypothetical protein ACWEPL_04390 [Nonomuraea sp. NPDC004186]